MIDGGLRKLFSTKLPQVHWQPIETGGTGRGIPDLNGCYRGAEFWIELKATSAWAVRVRPEQIAWLGRRYRNGGRVFVAVRRKARAGVRRRAADELWIVPGDRAFILNEGGLLAAQSAGAVLAVYQDGPAKWPWLTILEALSGRLADELVGEGAGRCSTKGL